MIFHNFPEAAVGSKVKTKVLLYLLSEGLPTSEREIARLLGISHMAVSKAMKSFYGINLVSPLKVGNALVWKVNEESYAYSALKDLKVLATRTPLQQLKNEIKSAFGAYTSVKKVVLYGSIAGEKELPDSDIDLLILVEDERSKKNVLDAASKLSEKCLRLFGNRLSPLVLTGKDAKSGANKRILESAESGIVVMG